MRRRTLSLCVTTVALSGLCVATLGSLLPQETKEASTPEREEATTSAPTIRAKELTETVTPSTAPTVRAIELTEEIQPALCQKGSASEGGPLCPLQADTETLPPKPMLPDRAPAPHIPAPMQPSKMVHLPEAAPVSLPTQAQPEAPLVSQSTPAPSATPAPTQTESDEEIFQRLFSRTAPTASAVVLPFLIDGVALGELLVEIAPESEEVHFAAAPLLEALAPQLHSKAAQSLAALVDQRGRISLQSLQKLGLEAAYDASALELTIKIPANLRATSIHSAQKSGLPAAAQGALRPSPFSGYLNAKGAQKVLWSSTSKETRDATDGTELERQAFGLGLDGALQWRGWVAEGRATFIEESDNAWSRGDLLFSRDDTKKAIRYMAGDFSAPAVGLQPSIPVAGIGLSRNFALQPYQGRSPTGQFELFLERPAAVDVYLNGNLLQTLQLPAGRHDVRDLPMAAGVNDIKLVVRDEAGLSRELTFRTGTTSELLAPGVHQFAYSAGAPLSAQEEGREYELSQPVLSLSHRAGLTNTVTLGGYLYASLDRQIAGPQLLWATPLGNLGLDLAGSHDESTGTGAAIALRYQYLKPGRAARKISASLEHRSAGFLPVGALSSSAYSDDLLLAYGQQIGAGWQTDLSLRYQVSKEDFNNACTAGGVITRSLKGGLGLSLFASVRQGGTTPNEARGMLTLRWSLPERGQALQLLSKNSTLEEHANQLSWSYQGRSPSESVFAAATVTESKSAEEASGLVGYTGQRMQANLSSAAIWKQDGAEATTSIEGATALVFAGGRFALSRPVNGAFAIVVPNETVRGYRIAVNPGPYGDLAWTDRLGPAVLSNLQPYHLQELKLAAPELPIGYSLGEESIALLPTYKSGTLIRTGEEGTVSLRGELYFADGTPVSLISGELVPVEAPERQRVFLFTNRAGRFGLEAVIPGKYELVLVGLPPLALEIPEGQRGGYSLGKLIVNP